MTAGPPFDPRSVANCLLEVAWKYDLKVTHLALQKIIYFLHAQYLKETDTPLCKGYFEAWKHGPVHPQIWTTFKNAGRDPIRHTAYGIDIETGISKKIDEIEDKAVLLFIARKGLELLAVPAPRLVGMSHLPGGPWDKLTRDSGGQRQYGTRISNEHIAQWHHARIASLSDSQFAEEDLYEQPPA